jgi:hypothetical protein
MDPRLGTNVSPQKDFFFFFSGGKSTCGMVLAAPRMGLIIAVDGLSNYSDLGDASS